MAPGRRSAHLGALKCYDQKAAAPEPFVTLALNEVTRRSRVVRFAGPNFDGHDASACSVDDTRVHRGGADRGPIRVGSAADHLARPRRSRRAVESKALPVQASK